jgi:hypothetical protein
MSNAFTVAALIFSLIAIAVSLFTALKQATLMRHANALPVTIDLVREFRAPEFKKSYYYVTQELTGQQAPSLGYRLPNDAAERVIAVSHFWDNLGLLVRFGIVNEQLIIAFMGSPILRSWVALEPYIRAERAMRVSGQQGSDDYQEFFEHLAALATRKSPSSVIDDLHLEKMPRRPL